MLLFLLRWVQLQQQKHAAKDFFLCLWIINSQHFFIVYERKQCFHVEKDYFSSTFWSLRFNNNIMDVIFGLCLNSGRICETPFRPKHYCSLAIQMANCKTHGALTHSLDLAAFKNYKLGLCMVTINIKYIAAGQKRFYCSSLIMSLQLKICLMLCFKWIVN